MLAVVLICASLLLVGEGRAEAREGSGAAWPFEHGDIAADRGYRFGRLDNGMRYVIRQNRNPRGTAQIRMDVAAGSLDEEDAERGFAHFVEHMAFNGSARLAEGEMIRTLERHGLANGPDTNAATGFLATTYRFDLPRNDVLLLDLSLMLMREIASELTFDPGAVERARGVVLAEMRDRNTWQRRNSMAEAAFLNPKARYPNRFSIGSAETIGAATADGLRAFWRRVYVPQKTTMIVIGDFDPATVERAIRARFAGWRAGAGPPQPDAGPIEADDGGRTAIFVEPPISERVIASRHGAWIDGPDSVARQEERWLRRIAYGVVNRRFQRIARRPDPPFRAASLGTGGVLRSGRTTSLAVDTVDGTWRAGLTAAVREYRRAIAFGFAPAEVAEQVDQLRARMEVAAASAGGRRNDVLMHQIMELLRDDIVPAAPDDLLRRFVAFIPTITPERVHAAMLREALPLDDPLLRFEGGRYPAGGEQALRDAWNAASALPLDPAEAPAEQRFGYASFGPPGRIESDSREPIYGIRRVRFANGVMLNLKRTRLEKGRVRVRVAVDGGEMLDTRENPTVTQLVRVLPVGGLGKHTLDDLQSLRAGHITGFSIAAETQAFIAAASTTPADLELQLQLHAALITDPGYREQGEVEYRLNTNAYFNGLSATPASALGAAIGGILSDGDPRFSLQQVEVYRRLTFGKLRADIADRLEHGAIEVALVGDLDEKQAIAAVARTFGALPARERSFRAYADQRDRPFTADRTPRIVRHTGPKDQALLRLTWLTRDDSDPREALALALLERVVRIALTETLRQSLGKAYSPEASSRPSRFWRGFGTFAVAAEVDVAEVPETRRAIAETLAALRAAPVGGDLFQRALQPMLQGQRNALKSNGGWMSIVDEAQSEPDRIARFHNRAARMRTLTALDVQRLARRYLTPEAAVEVRVLPEGAAEQAASR